MIIKEQYLILIENIKFYRKKQNLTQEQLAELADLSSSYIKQIESAKIFKNLTFYTTFKIAKALNVDVSELFKKNNTKIGV